MSNFALIEHGVVKNIIIWDGEGDLFSNCEIINIDHIDAGVGWFYSDGEFIAPPEPEMTEYDVGNIDAVMEADTSTAPGGIWPVPPDMV
ncbi:phage tail protein [Escherichia coli]